MASMISMKGGGGVAVVLPGGLVIPEMVVQSWQITAEHDDYMFSPIRRCSIEGIIIGPMNTESEKTRLMREAESLTVRQLLTVVNKKLEKRVNP